MDSTDVAFSRRFLAIVHEDVRIHGGVPNPIEAASVTGPSFGQYFVQIRPRSHHPQDLSVKSYDAWVKADNKYHARALAWASYMEKFFPDFGEQGHVE